MISKMTRETNMNSYKKDLPHIYHYYLQGKQEKQKFTNGLAILRANNSSQGTKLDDFN